MKKIFNIAFYIVLGIIVLSNFLPNKTEPTTEADKSFKVTIESVETTYASLYKYAETQNIELKYKLTGDEKLFTIDYTFLFISPKEVVMRHTLVKNAGLTELQVYGDGTTINPGMTLNEVAQIFTDEGFESTASVTPYTIKATRANPPMWYATAIGGALVFMAAYAILYKAKEKKLAPQTI